MLPIGELMRNEFGVVPPDAPTTRTLSTSVSTMTWMT
jgi:hypothetical protein